MNRKKKTTTQVPKEDALSKIFSALKAHGRVDFNLYKLPTLKRRIQRRMTAQKTSSLNTYADNLHKNKNEINLLFADLLINVTEFFRDPKSHTAMIKTISTNLLKNRTEDAPIRVWVPACSTGQEAYSLAMSLVELLSESGQNFPIQIFATDISEPVLQKARLGVYSADLVKGVNKVRLKRFFTQVEGGYRIKKEIREMCLFSRHDVTIDPPFAKLDLVSCRNVLIYFSSILQKRVIPLFH
jgi:two-component system CheB/CheR fusion protein